MTAVSVNQFLCNNKVHDDYFTYALPETAQARCTTVKKVIDAFPNEVVYIGITHHPCGRFTGGYTNSRPLPTKFNFIYSYSPITEELLLERPHKDMYKNMYVLFCSKSLDQMREIERELIECANKHAPGLVNNDSPGGSGNIPASDFYFLYICTSLILNG